MNTTMASHQSATAEPKRGARSSRRVIASWIFQIIAVLILGQTLFFKFTGAEESIYIFETLGVEPWGRYGSGLVEFTAIVLLLIPRTVVLGAGLALAVMLGAIASHLGPLGIEVQDDGGLLFALANIVALAAMAIIALRPRQVRTLLRLIIKENKRT